MPPGRKPHQPAMVYLDRAESAFFLGVDKETEMPLLEFLKIFNRGRRSKKGVLDVLAQDETVER